MLQYALGIVLGAVIEMTFVFSTTFTEILMQCILFGICNGKWFCLTGNAIILRDVKAP